MRRKVTIGDVAKAAGVSKTLVSFVMNGRPEVGESTKQRVLAIIAELGYRPSQQARFLVQRRTGTVGLLVEIRAYTDPMVLHFLASVGERLAENGYGLLLLGGGPGTPLEKTMKIVGEDKVDGLVIMDVRRDDARVEWLEEVGFPYVTYCTTDTPRSRYVDVDHAEAARLATAHMVERQYRKVAVVTGPAHYTYSYLRWKGFEAEAERRGIELGPVFEGDFTETFGWQVGRRLAESSDLPHAVYSVTDIMAAGVIRGLLAHGVRVPDDVAVIGFGNSPVGIGIHPSLSTIHLPNRALGYAAVDAILAQIDGRETNGPWIFQPHLIVRESG